MADEPGESDGNSDSKRLAAYLGVLGAIVSILVGVNSLTGVNPLGWFVHSSPTTTAILTPTRRDTPTWTATSTTTRTTATTTTTERTTLTTTTTTAATPPLFLVDSQQFSAPCSSAGCGMSAIFRNIGGFGSGTATFYLMPDDGSYTYLALCTAVIPGTNYHGFASAGCNAYSNISQWSRTHPGTNLTFRGVVNTN